MDPDTKMMHLLLETWGKWAKDSGIQGYPRCSSTERAARYGKLGIPQESNYKGEPEIPEQIAVLDAAIARLGDIDKRRRGVVLHALGARGGNCQKMWDAREAVSECTAACSVATLNCGDSIGR